MAATVPTKEPLTIRAGDTIEWTKSIDDYKASDGWTLSYSFRGTGGTIDITNSAEGLNIYLRTHHIARDGAGRDPPVPARSWPQPWAPHAVIHMGRAGYEP